MTNQNLFAAPTSKHDLPLELQLDYLREMLEIKRLSYIETLDEDLEEQFAELTSKQKDDDDEKQTNEENTNNFEGVRDIALNLLLYNTCLKIGIYEDIMSCGDVPHGEDPLPYSMFSWTREDYIERRQIKNIIWVTVLQKMFSPKCLEVKKIKTDIQSVTQFLEILFAAFKTTNQKVREDVQKFIRDAYVFKNIYSTLKKEFDRHKKIINRGMESFLALDFYRRESQIVDNRNELEAEIEILNIIQPIEQRYNQEYHDSRTNQHQIKMDLIVNSDQKKVDEFVKKIEMENFRSQCVTQLLYQEMERYKLRIASMTERYDKDYEAINNEISYKRNSLEKIKEQRKYCLEQIERFKEELEQSRLRMLRQAELEQNRLKKLAEWRKKLKKSKTRSIKA